MYGCDLQGELPKISGVYAFVTDSETSYIGVAENSLARRVRRYACNLRNPKFASSHRGLRKLYVGMRELLQAGSRIDVWICTDVSVTTSRGRVINGAKAIEADLIKRLQPRWNILGVADNNQTFIAGALRANAAQPQHFSAQHSL
jgi:excinuclease UvrABC nuclease subunit